MNYSQEMEHGDVESWLLNSPVVSFQSQVSNQFVRRKRSPIKPVGVQANMELQSFTQFFDLTSTWKIEWQPGHRLCHIRSVSNQGYYWKWTSKAYENNHLLVDSFLNKDETGPYLTLGKDKNTRYRPTMFYIAVTASSIAFQIVKTSVWLSVDNKGNIYGSTEFTDNCNFRVASKISLFTAKLPGIAFKNSYMSSSLINNKLVVEPRLADKRFMLFLYPKADHFLLFSPQVLKYVFIDGDHLAIGATSEQQACHIRFKIVDELWKMYVWVESVQKYVRTIVHERCVYLKTALPPGEAIEKAKEAGEYNITYHPMNRSTTTTSSSDQLPLQKGSVFGISLDQLIEREGSDIPCVVEQLTTFISQRKESEGLFRLSGSKTLELQLIELIDSGKPPAELFSTTPRFSESEACGLLKEFMRRSPLISNELKEQLMTIVSSPAGSENDNLISITFAGETLQYYQSIQTKLKIYLSRNCSRNVYALLKHLCVFFHYLGGYYESNKLTLANMVIVFLPCLTELPDMSLAWSNTFKILVADVSSVFL